MEMGARKKLSAPFPFHLSRESDFVELDLRRFASILGDIDREVAEERGRFTLQQSKHRHRQTPDLQLRAFARTQLE